MLDVKELDKLCKERIYCWSIGTSRVSSGQKECRIFPLLQDDKRPVRIIIDSSLEECVLQAIEILKRIQKEPISRT